MFCVVVTLFWFVLPVAVHLPQLSCFPSFTAELWVHFEAAFSVLYKWPHLVVDHAKEALAVIKEALLRALHCPAGERKGHVVWWRFRSLLLLEFNVRRTVAHWLLSRYTSISEFIE